MAASMGSGKRVDIIFYGDGPFEMGRLSTMLFYIRKNVVWKF